MLHNRLKLLAVSLLLVLGAACSPQQPSTLPPAPQQPANQVDGSPSPTNAPPSPTTELPTPTLEPLPLLPSSSPVASVVHQAKPGNPSEVLGKGNDQDSSATASQKRASGGDVYSQGNLERPFNANSMDIYYPEIDIQQMGLGEDGQWIYTTITLKGADKNNKFSGTYALEIDVDLDGRGDFLILATNPAAGDWSTDGVQALIDSNDDVGNHLIPGSDPPQTGDGYDKLIFNQGIGDDPDVAWSRVSPDDPNSIQIAVKKSLFNDIAYLWGVWAAKNLTPGSFDLNDHFTFAEAGSPDVGYDIYYPIKALSEVDNTCRLPAGFQPSGTEPALCSAAAPEDACSPPPGGCQYGWNPQRCSCIQG